MIISTSCIRPVWAVILFCVLNNAQCQTSDSVHGRFRVAQPGRFIELTRPEYISAEQAKLVEDAPVVGLALGTDARCYPLRQLWYHHVINDEIDGQNLSLTYCVMANTAVTYRLENLDRDAMKVGGLFGGVLALGSSDSSQLWPQIASVEVPGCITTSSLTLGPEPTITTWNRWRTLYPKTKVLKPVKQFTLSYEAYDGKPRGYQINPLMNETVTVHDDRLSAGDEVYGISIGTSSKAWTLSSIKASTRVNDKVGTTPVSIEWDDKLDSPRVSSPLPLNGLATRAFWYAWSSFYPQTDLIK